MGDFLLVELNKDLVIGGKMLIKGVSHSWDVSLGHGSERGKRSGSWQTVKLDILGHGGTCRLERESDIDQLLDVDVSVPVLSSGEGSGKSCSTRVNSLPLVSQIDSSSDFLDQKRGKTLGSELFVDA